MIDHPFVILQHLLKNYKEACDNTQYAKAYEIAIDITDQAQKLEDIAHKLQDYE
jgi:hypothetical protein